MTDTTEMNELIRSVLEDFGVVQPPKLPKVDILLREIRKRGGSVSLAWNDKAATASVGLSGNTFDAAADTPAVAVAEAFAQALQAEPAQTSFLGGDGTLSSDIKERLERLRDQQLHDGDEDEGDAA